jgi:hypothetical protein
MRLWGRVTEGKQFFFEKKNQKTFGILAFSLQQRMRKSPKFFASFLKKKRFLAFMQPDT